MVGDDARNPQAEAAAQDHSCAAAQPRHARATQLVGMLLWGHSSERDVEAQLSPEGRPPSSPERAGLACSPVDFGS